MLIRFAALATDIDSGQRGGVLVAAHMLRDEGDLTADEHLQLRTELSWFNEHLRIPPELEQRSNRRAISWFKPAAHEAIQRMWRLKTMLGAHGVHVEVLRTLDPGTLTGIYDLLTFGLLVFVAYEALAKPKRANLAIYFEERPVETKQWGWVRQTMDFVIENNGNEIKNVKILSEPDFLGWDNLGKGGRREPRSTSQYFQSIIPCLRSGERRAFFWCDMEQSTEILKKPFEISVEYDNPVLPFPRRCIRSLKFDFTAFDGTMFPLNSKYDVHNVAQELTRIRELLESRDKA